MSDMLDTLKGLLGDNADEKLDGIMKIINPDGASSPSVQTNESFNEQSEISPEMINMLKSAMSKMGNGIKDDRTKLLMSLKPYMGENRQSTIDSAIRMLNLSQFSEFFKGVI